MTKDENSDILSPGEKKRFFRTIDDTKIARFYDPLYEVVVFQDQEKALGAKGFFTDLSLAGDVTDILSKEVGKHFTFFLNSYEMNRLNYLKQSGLAYLVYPSATHTRFSHSLGCWVLAERALQNVWVQIGDGLMPIKLGEWLEGGPKRLTEEFMLSLLFHDIGHFPFSHAIEDNEKFGGITHEEVTSQLLQGEGRYFDIFKKYAQKRSRITSEETKLTFLSEYLKKHETIDVDAMCSLITLDFTKIGNKPQQEKNNIYLLSQLVSGLIDLDRLDHYQRDSYFMGVRIANFNMKGLLYNMILMPSEQSTGAGAHIMLLDDGVMHAFNLLFSKEQLMNQVFNNPQNVAYNEMLNFCVSKYIECDKLDADARAEILFWTDDELIQTLQRCNYPEIQEVVSRIHNRLPYQLVDNPLVKKKDYYSRSKLSSLKEEILNHLRRKNPGASEKDVLFSVPKSFPGIKKEMWMDLNNLINKNGKVLRYVEQFSEFIRYLEEENARNNTTIWIFASTPEIANEVRDYLHDKMIFE